MSRRSMLIVANERYEDPAIQKLQWVQRDADELFAFFRNRPDYQSVEILRDASSERIADMAAEMCATLRDGDLFVFCFFGHGAEHEGKHLLLCPQARLSRLNYLQQVVPVDLLKQETAQTSANRAFILDACRTSLRAARDAGSQGLKGERGLRTLVEAPTATAAGSLTILCACSEGQQAAEVPALRHGLFTKAFLEMLHRARDAGRPLVLTSSLQQQLRQRMRMLAREHGYPEDQSPWIQSGGGNEPVLLSGTRGAAHSSEPATSLSPEEWGQPGAAAEHEKYQQALAALKRGIKLTFAESYAGTRRAVTIPSGSGYDIVSTQLSIPAGVPSGTLIEIPREEKGSGLWIRVTVRRDPRWSVEDDDLRMQVEVPEERGEIVLALPDGSKVTAALPDLSMRAGDVTLRLVGRGLLSLPQAKIAYGSQLPARGDLLATIVTQWEQPTLDVHRAAILGDLPDVMRNLTRGTPVDVQDEEERTPLHCAAIWGQEAMARALIKHGANVNACSKNQWTPLHWAALKGHGAVVRALVEGGAQVDARSIDLAKGSELKALLQARRNAQLLRI